MSAPRVDISELNMRSLLFQEANSDVYTMLDRDTPEWASSVAG